MKHESHTWHEIASQPGVWRATLEGFAGIQEALREFLVSRPFEEVVVTGCGSTHYLSQTVALNLIHWAGIPARALPASELWLNAHANPAARALLLTISRSGTTTETLRALSRFRESTDGPVVAITCHPQSALAQQADFTLAAPDAQEHSVVQTRSFTSMLLLGQALAATLGRNQHALEGLRRLPVILEGLMDRTGDLIQHLGADTDIERLSFLGGGPLYGLANEAMLKTQEMTLTHADAYYPLEFRHGPMSMVDERTLVVAFVSDTGLAEQLEVLEDVKALGARTLVLVEDSSVLTSRQADHVAELQSGLEEWYRAPLYLPIIQRLAYHRALAKGLDPDSPRHLTAVVVLKS